MKRSLDLCGATAAARAAASPRRRRDASKGRRRPDPGRHRHAAGPRGGERGRPGRHPRRRDRRRRPRSGAAAAAVMVWWRCLLYLVAAGLACTPALASRRSAAASASAASRVSGPTCCRPWRSSARAGAPRANVRRLRRPVQQPQFVVRRSQSERAVGVPVLSRSAARRVQFVQPAASANSSTSTPLRHAARATSLRKTVGRLAVSRAVAGALVRRQHSVAV